MNEVKFKVWDKILIEWCYDWLISHKGVHSDGGWDDICASHDTTDRYILCQYIGLNDKNGVEIHEAALLERNGEIYKIIYSAGAYGYVNIKNEMDYGAFVDSGRIPGAYRWDEFEIIGSECENPELL